MLPWYQLCRASKKIILPDPSVRSVMIKYLEKTGDISFDKIFHQRLGYLLFKVIKSVRQFKINVSIVAWNGRPSDQPTDQPTDRQRGKLHLQ